MAARSAHHSRTCYRSSDRHLAATAIASILTALTLTPASAQTVLPEILVLSSSLTPIEASKVGSAVTVLPGDEIRSRGFNTLSDALRTVPGVHVNQSGARGSLTQVRVRGTEANHLLVIVDGVPVNATGDGEFNFADIPVDDIERVEVLRGPQSGLYGANAHSGVLTIETLSGRGMTKPQLRARIEGGTQGSGEVSASARGAAGPFYGSVTVAHGQTQGFNIARTGTETDGAYRQSMTAKGGIEFSPYFNVEGFFRVFERSAETDPQSFATGLVFDRASDRSLYDDVLGRVQANLTLFDGRWIQSAKWTTSRQNVSGIETGPVSFSSHGVVDTLSYKSTVIADTAVIGGEQHRLTALVEDRRESFRYADQFLFGTDVLFWQNGRGRSSQGLSGEYILDLAATGTTLSAVLRQDWNEPFDDEFTWRYSASQKIGNTGARLHASVGRGVTNPNFFELYGFSPSSFIGNPNLVPESSIGWDAGIEQALFDRRFVIDVTYFQSRLRNEIQTIFVPPGSFTAVNLVGISKREGVEVTGKVSPTPWLLLTGGYTYTDSRDPMDVPEIRRPRHAANGSATVKFASDRGKATVNVVYNGQMRDTWFKTPSETVFLKAYTLVGGQISYDVTPWATAYVRAENLFDTQYEDVFSYRSPGFAAYAGLRFKTPD